MLRFLTKCQISKVGEQLQILDCAEMIRLIICKFSQSVQDSWNKYALSIKRKKDRLVSLKDIINFVETQTDLVSNPEFSRTAYSEGKEKLVRTFATAVETPRRIDQKCAFCSEDHVINQCESFEPLSVKEKLEFLYNSRLCYGCFKPTNRNHYSSVCCNKPECTRCGGKHQTMLCESEISLFSVNAVKNCSLRPDISLSIIPVSLSHKKDPSQSVTVYAMLDPCSQETFMDEGLIDHLASTISYALMSR